MTAHSRRQATHRRGTTNVYADLGYRAPDSMLVKAQLVSKLAELLAVRRMMQARGAIELGIPRSELSNVLCGQFRKFCERELLSWLTILGRDIQREEQ
jgi:predicted XRE-type DNA-binding protein